MEPTISNIKRLLRWYRSKPWGCIWRDSFGVHYRDHHWDAVIYGDLRWARWKGLR